MSQGHDDRIKLARLAEAFMQDILEMSDDEILAMVDRERLSHVRTLLSDVKTTVAKRVLAEARAARNKWTASQSSNVLTFDRSTAREQFEKLRSQDPALNRKMTLAARNGTAPTDNDIEGLIKDWEDLKRLDGADRSE